jgi:hypothetical protein
LRTVAFVRRFVVVVAVMVLALVACSDEDAGDVVVGASTSTAPFDGGTTPVSVPSTSGVALLTSVSVEVDSVTFTFRDGAPGYLVEYVEPPITQDGSGEEMTVGGEAYLSVRMEPASGVDLSGDEFVETYVGPDRIDGVAGSVLVEVVRTGDFEAVLNWVIGLDAQRPFRVDVDGPSLTVTFDAG